MVVAGGGMGYGAALWLLRRLPDRLLLSRRPPNFVSHLRLAIRSDMRTVTVFSLAILLANVRPWRRERRRGRRGRNANRAEPAA